jgi:shikimate dehydrogenase
MIILGLIGYPLTHSLSPKIHKAALTACGLDGDYLLFSIPPNDLHGLKKLLRRVRRGEVQGLNVTIPHKQTVIPLLDKLNPTAEAIGAVNTISMQNGVLTGDNTDAAGFIADLHKFLAREVREGEGNQASLPAARHALILGAGGSARAVTHALLKDGWKVTLAARRPEQAEAIIAQFPKHTPRPSFVKFRADALAPLLSSLGLVVNTTPVGMSPNIGISPWPEGTPFPQRALFYDLVYNPRNTKLVLEARANGLPAETGLGMLVEQAALAFKLWTGHDVARKPLFSALTFNEYITVEEK